MTLVLGYFAVRDVNPGEVREALELTVWWWLLPALAVFALSNVIRAVRWYYMFVPEARPPLRAVTEALFIGYFFNNIFPARAGEAARVVALHQRTDASRAITTGTVAIERVYDLATLLILLFLAVPWLPEVTWLKTAAALSAVLVGLLAVTVALLMVYGDRPVRFAMRPLTRLPFLSAERVDRAAGNLAKGLAAVRQPRLAIAAVLWTTLSWLVMALSYWLVMVAFDLDLSPLAGLFVLIAVGLSMILPSSPAAVGVFEAAVIVALDPYDVAKSVALSYGLILHAMNFAFYVLVGAVVLRIHALAIRAVPDRRVSGAPLNPEV